MLTIEQASNRYNVSKYALKQLAEANNAVVHIGERVVRINKAVLDDALNIKP